MIRHVGGQLLDAYVEGGLEPEVCRHVEQHLAKCLECSTRLGQHKRLSQLAAYLPMEPAPEGLILRVQLALAQLAARRRTIQQLRELSWLSAILSLLGLILVGIAWQPAWNNFLELLKVSEGGLTAQIWQALVNFNWDTWLQAGASWQTQLIKDVDAVLLAGAIMLSLAAFAGLARLLLAAQYQVPMQGEE